MRYIGPFLRINILSNDKIKSQLFHFSKESFRHIILHSGCGIICRNSDLKSKFLPKDDDTTNSAISPLLCVYRKADGKLLREKDTLIWNHRKFKKEINICANGYMNLTLLYLSDYFRSFKGIDNDKFNLSKYYSNLANEQLEFFATHCRNNEGVFVDKYDSTDPLQKEYSLTDKDMKFKFSTQALLMAAYYKCYTVSIDCDNSNEDFKAFALDILKLFQTLKEQIYNTSHDELVKICLAFNILYECSKLDEVKELLIDFSELMLENINHMPASVIRDNIDISCICYINSILTYKNTGIITFKTEAFKLYNILETLYDNDTGIFIKDASEKENKFSSDEIILYLYVFMIHESFLNDNEKSDLASKVHNLYKKQVINSGIILRWIDPPNLDDVSRYLNYSNKSEDMLDDSYFMPTPSINIEANDLAPIFIKSISLNRKKESYKHYKHSFDSCKNMFNFFIVIFLNDTLNF
ncbi:MAG: hypothetical protein RR636_09685 [Clostridium sp.]|uniref:hypothetical protein n=1 Tax=Clostridium sp. TaxID=1506 RepID=UPI0030311A6F